jgi:predicted nucleotide-binding protein
MEPDSMPKPTPSNPTSDAPSPAKGKRARLSQSDVPSMSVIDALRIPKALRDDCGSQPTVPLLVAKAVGMQPSGGSFRMLTGAAVAYGLTDGAAQSTTIGLADLGRRAVRPTSEGDDTAALREAAIKPRVMREFLQKYNGSKFPNDVIAKNVLVTEMSVPEDAAERALATIKATAEAVGFLQNVGSSIYIHLGAALPTKPSTALPDDDHSVDEAAEAFPPAPPADVQPPAAPQPINDLSVNKRVFITHGKDKDVVSQLEEVLKFGGFEAVVSVNKEATAKPVPDKVMDDMRSCAAGIVHVSAEKKLLDDKGIEHTIINPNVLIEIGAALALYKRNFILLVEHGVELPSNLQGLYEVRYDGGKLDYEATMKLLRAFNEFKTT